MKIDKDLLSSGFIKLNTTSEFQQFFELEYYKMNTSSDCDPNSSSAAYSDSGYLTNYNHESQSLSTNSSGMSSEDLYPQAKPLNCEIPVQNDIYFCENAVFDEPKLEGPPILSEDISVDLNKYIQQSVTAFSDSGCAKFAEKLPGTQNIEQFPQDSHSNMTVIENSCSNSKVEAFCFQKLINSAEKKNVKTVTDVSDTQNNTIETDSSNTVTVTENSNPKNELCFEKLINSETVERQDVSASNNQSDDDVHELSFEIPVQTVESIIVPKVTTPNKPITNVINPDLSPELFSDEEIEEEIMPINNLSTTLEQISQTQKPLLHNEQLLRNDRKLLRRVQEAVSGVPPPPSVTILQITVADMLDKIHSNKKLFLTDIFGSGSQEMEKHNDGGNNGQSVRSLLITSTKEEIEQHEWPEIINCRYHGLHYNRTKVSEDFEFYCTKYLSRFVGAETASSCTIWSTNMPGSASKKRNAKRWGIKSPGRRLSHLAKRRITFSSSNLQASCCAATMSVIGASNVTSRQLVIDARKTVSLAKRKSPWKKSPRKSPQKRIKTPGSSAKKSSHRRHLFGGDDESKPSTSRIISTKRALFQSPEHSRSTTSSAVDFSKNKPRRNLFVSPRKNSPAKMKNSPLKNYCDTKKRKRADEENHPSKFPRSLSFDTHHTSALQAAASGNALPRRHSEMSVGSTSSTSSTKGELSDLHKKKLIWAVSESLKKHHISMSHPKFRQYANILCRIVKHQMPDLLSLGPRQPGSTSERMSRIAHQHVFAVTRGKTYDEIVQQINETNANLKNLKQPTGYVPPEAFKSDEVKVKSVLQDKILNIECNQNRNTMKSPDAKSSRVDENNKMRIRRQIMFDDVDTTRSLNPNR